MSSKKKASKVQTLDNNWIAVPSKSYSNRVYYFNKVTRETTWKNPCKKSSSAATCLKESCSAGGSGERKSNEAVNTLKAKTTLKISERKPKEWTDKSVDKNSKTKRKPEDKIVFKLKSTVKNASTTDIGSTQANTSPSFNSLVQKNLRSSSSKNQKESVQPCICSKGSCGKRKCKTAAQARLIQKRKEYEELLKRKREGVHKQGSKADIICDRIQKQTNLKTHNVHKRSVENNFDVNYGSHLRNNSVNTKLKDVLRGIGDNKNSNERVDTLLQVVENNEEESLVTDDHMCIEDEEMDWEPMEQEVLIEHIKTIRRNLDTADKLSGDIILCSNTNIETESESNNLILVFDTNVLISCLTFIKEIHDTFIPGSGLPNFFIPWRVLQELDHLKNSSNKQLQLSSISAIRYINKILSSRHPRARGQSFEEYASMLEQKCSSPDDEILLVCLKLKSMENHKTVVLITNDKNLESKAIVSNLEAFSKDRFVKEKVQACRKIEPSLPRSSVPDHSKSEKLKNDELYCKLNDSLKTSLAQLLETELKNAFDKEWRKLVLRKPPWSLLDILDCIIKHWISVFTFIFGKGVLLLVENLKQHIRSSKSGQTEVGEMIEISKELLSSMRNQTESDKPYRKVLDDTLLEVQNLSQPENVSNRDRNYPQEETSEKSAGFSSASEQDIQTSGKSTSQEVHTVETSMFDQQLCKEKVKNLFKVIWDQISNFCAKIAELISMNGTHNFDAVNQIKCQLPVVKQKVQELIEIIHKILSFGPNDGDQANQLILHFANFLVGLNVVEIEPSELNNFPMYIAIFCGDNDGRQVLYAFANDLKQFDCEITNGLKAFGLV